MEPNGDPFDLEVYGRQDQPSTDPMGAGQPRDSFVQLVEGLSVASVRRRWEAYRDVDWDDPAHELHYGDPAWDVAAWDPLGQSDWYSDQPADRRSAIGLHRTAAFFKVGIEFESVLCEGLFRFASKLPNGHPAFRYIYHEISEEAQHSMMFQEFINRSSFDPAGSPAEIQTLYRRLAWFADDKPVLFFLAALSGEEAFDYLQRRMLADRSTHALLRRINRIHVAEEARHLSFARGWLRHEVPRLDVRELRHLRYQAPFVVRWMAERIFDVSASFADTWGVPQDTLTSVADGPRAGEVRRKAMVRVVALCQEIGLASPRLAGLWSKLGGS